MREHRFDGVPGQGRIGGVREVGRRGPSTAFTLIELFVVLGILSILVLVAFPSLLRFQTRAKVSASKNNQRILVEAIEIYRVDHDQYPVPLVSPDDPFGVVGHCCLRVLTTPVAYVSCEAFHDPFGALQIQLPVMAGYTGFTDDPFRPPTPGFNTGQSMLYFYYPCIAAWLGERVPAANAFAVVSVGPDLKDSFIVYFPFPEGLPGWAALYGIRSTFDTVYDPTNGTISGGDLAAFGGSLSVPRFVGGGK